LNSKAETAVKTQYQHAGSTMREFAWLRARPSMWRPRELALHVVERTIHGAASGPICQRWLEVEGSAGFRVQLLFAFSLS
jgi:hypothetical protein